MENYPGGLPNMIDHRFELSGDLGVGELLFGYDGDRVYICDVVELHDGKIKSTRAYFGKPFEAAEWRARWVERM